MTDRPKQIVRKGYDAIAERYLAWSRDSAPRRHYLEKLLAQLENGERVLELGCGAGLPATKALSERAAVTGVDLSPKQIALAKANVPTAEFLCAEITALDFAPGTFDAVAAFYAVTHIPREEHAALFARIAQWLKPGGIFVATLGAVDLEDCFEEDWLGAPNFFSHYGADTNLALLKAAGFEILEHEVAAQDLEGEMHIAFLWVVARKR